MSIFNGISTTSENLLAKDRRTAGHSSPELLNINREEEAGFYFSPRDRRPAGQSGTELLYDEREEDAGFRLSPCQNRDTGQLSSDMIHVKCEEDASLNLSQNQNPTKSITEAEYETLRSIGYLYGIIMESPIVNEPLPSASYCNNDVMSTQGYSLADWNPAIDQSPAISHQPNCNCNEDWWNVTGICRNSTQSPTTDQNQLSGFTSPSPGSELADEISGLNQLITKSEDSTSPNEHTTITVPLLQTPEPTPELIQESQEQSDVPKPNSTNTDVLKAAKRRSRCNRTKNISLLKGDATSEWQCFQCNRMFRNRGGLLQHNNTHHSGEKPFVCKFCGKRYHDEDAMLQHERRHTFADKPFKCGSCTKQYLHQYDLKRHIDLHHKAAPFTCKYCGKAFDRDDHVKDHETSHENGTVKRRRKDEGDKKMDLEIKV